MSDWLEFEIMGTQYLNNKFGDKAVFYHLGSADATVSDIKVLTKTGREFFIEAKLAPAQCGQFVLLPDVAERCFRFSEKNQTDLTPQVKAIIDHMNAEFEAYKEAGTKGKLIDLHDGGKIFSEWIISAYREKGTEFFITNEYAIFPLCDFERHFTVTATYRVKRSGSASVGKRNLPKVIQYIKDKEYPIERFCTVGSKLFIYSSVELHDERFVLDGFEYMFSRREEGFEIRKLSNTFNANVIFTITKKQENGLADNEFARALT